MKKSWLAIKTLTTKTKTNSKHDRDVFSATLNDLSILYFCISFSLYSNFLLRHVYLRLVLLRAPLQGCLPKRKIRRINVHCQGVDLVIGIRNLDKAMVGHIAIVSL